jgi:hypothetical protein
LAPLNTGVFPKKNMEKKVAACGSLAPAAQKQGR